MTTTRLTWESYKAQMARLAFLPTGNGQPVPEESWADWYTMLAGYFPGELQRAVTATLKDPATRFMPPPGVLIGRMDAHRRSVGGNDWDSTLAALEAEERGEEPPKLAERVDFDEKLPVLGGLVARYNLPDKPGRPAPLRPWTRAQEEAN